MSNIILSDAHRQYRLQLMGSKSKNNLVLITAD